MNLEKISELARTLLDSDNTDVAELAKAFLALEAAYGELRHRHISVVSENIMRKHEKLFKKLAELEKEEKNGL